jgi:hypothetical protein
MILSAGRVVEKNGNKTAMAVLLRGIAVGFESSASANSATPAL